MGKWTAMPIVVNIQKDLSGTAAIKRAMQMDAKREPAHKYS
jgi:hypothetical protein